jgi:hypothetical protein
MVVIAHFHEEFGGILEITGDQCHWALKCEEISSPSLTALVLIQHHNLSSLAWEEILCFVQFGHKCWVENHWVGFA